MRKVGSVCSSMMVREGCAVFNWTLDQLNSKAVVPPIEFFYVTLVVTIIFDELTYNGEVWCVLVLLCSSF